MKPDELQIDKLVKKSDATLTYRKSWKCEFKKKNI